MEQAEILMARSRDSRVLIVANLLNGQADWKIAETFHMDVKEVAATFTFVMTKLKNYLFRHCKPPIACDTLAEAKKDRINILAILPRLNLDKDPEFKNIITEQINDKNHKAVIK